MTDTSVPAITAKQELIDLINHDNHTTLTVDDVTFSAPTIVNYQGRNTQVTVSANPNSALSGSMNVFYNRLAVSGLGYIGVVSADAITPEEFLAMVSANKGIDLLAEEFEPFLVPVLEIGTVGQIALVAKTTAIKWYGQTTADYTFNLPPELALLSELVNITLPSQGYL
jgi:hypothetical protein